MLSENLDDKIKESLQQQDPAYDETSWQKMKLLLDKYLPEKKNDRRRFIFFLFFFLILGGGAAILFTNNNGGKTPVISSTQQETTVNAETIKSVSPENEINKNTNVNKTGEPESAAIVNEKNNSTKQVDVLLNNKNTTQQIPNAKKVKNTNTIDKLISTKPEPNYVIKPNAVAEVNIETRGSKQTELPVTNSNKPLLPNNKLSVEEKKEAIVLSETKPASENQEPTKADLSAEVLTKAETLVDKPKTTAPIKSKAKNKQSFLKNILFTLSAGPDVSTVGLNKTGKLQLAAGAGIGYKISNRLTIRTGIYSGRKIYTAKPEDYNPPKNFWMYYPNLKTIDANCKVLELPITLDYNFAITKKQNWFVSTGLSSLFMKKEEYNYYFKPAYSPQYIYYSHTYENKNKHYFSVLNLSGGFAKKINNQLTLQAEPYMKIALRGIGYGKVKLNSGGILFTAILQPFNHPVNKETKK